MNFAADGCDLIYSNFRKIVHLVSNHNPTLKNWLNNTKHRPYHVTYLSPDSQDEFISLLGEEIENKIKNEVKEASIIGLIANTTPDVSNVYQLIRQEKVWLIE